MPQVSIWEKETFYAPQDVIIIGSGFTGLWSAVKLLESDPQQKITILERGIIPTGASTRNAGFSCFGSPSELINDTITMGEDNLWRLVEMRYKGLQEIRRYFTADIIDYCHDGGYECFAENSADWQAGIEKLEWLNAGLKTITGKDNLYTVADEKLKTFNLKGFSHLIENKEEGGLHSGKLIQALLKKVQQAGVQVLTGVDVKGFEQKNNQVIIETNQHINFSAKKLLLCTNAFTKQLLPALDIHPSRGQVLVTSPIPGFTLKGTFHFDRGFYYFRNLGNRLLIGGARNKAFETEDTDEMLVTTTIQNELEKFIHEHITAAGSFTVTDRWSGIMGMGGEKMPIVKKLQPDIFCCVRMSGMGVALAPIVAEQVAQLISEN
ncbi:MAG: FAD-dependent oxidoreductase [Ferruginibacter sp.]